MASAVNKATSIGRERTARTPTQRVGNAARMIAATAHVAVTPVQAAR